MIVKDGVLLEVSEFDIVDGTFDNWEIFTQSGEIQTITSIGDHAFQDVYNLEKIIIPDSVTSIGMYAFESCNELKEVIMYDSVTKIEKGAFSCCSKLEKIRLSKNLTVIEQGLFSYDYELKSIIFPKKLKEIKDEAFLHTGIRKIELPSNLKVIGIGAFKNCENLENIELPLKLKEIKRDAFSHCENLESIDIPGSVQKIDYYTFYRCDYLEEVILHEGIKEIRDSSFEKCSNLRKINFPESLEQIKGSAFRDCIKLDNIIIPNNITEIKSYTFDGCSSLKKIKLPNSLELIEDFALAQTKIKSVKFPKSLIKIGNDAFKYCMELEDIKFNDNLKEIGIGAFRFCHKIKNLDFNENLEKIAPFCFNGCSSLTRIKLPHMVKEIHNVFNNCDNLNIIEYLGKEYEIKKYQEYFAEKEVSNNTLIKIIMKINDDVLFPKTVKYSSEFIKLLDKEEIEKIICHDSYKHFKNIYHKYIEGKELLVDDIRDFYKFAYVLGCFSNEIIELDGRKIDVSQKASVFFEALLDNGIFEISVAHDYFDNLEVKKYNVDFFKFITQNNSEKEYENFMYLLDKGRSMSLIINDFDQIMNEVIVDDRGRIIKKPSIKRKIENYLINCKFEKVNDSNRDIASEFALFHSIKQHNFDEANEIRELGKKAKHHIVDEELKEENIFDSIEKLKNSIEEKIITSKEMLDELFDLEFTYEWLDKHDPKNFTLGLYCDCCASIVSVHYGKEIMNESIINDSVQNLIIRNAKGDIVAKSTIYVNKDKGYAVFNDIEMNRKYGNEVNEDEYSDSDLREKIYKAFKRGVKAFVTKYNEKNSGNPINQVNIGWGYNRLKQVIKKYEVESDEVFEALDCFKDASNKQYVIYKK